MTRTNSPDFGPAGIQSSALASTTRGTGDCSHKYSTLSLKSFGKSFAARPGPINIAS
jgi:hypothetical protein